MKSPHDKTERLQVEGVVEHVDTVNRDLSISAKDRVRVFDVPLACSILLNGESVKLRLLQPGDRVRIIYRRGNEMRTAEWIEAGVGLVGVGQLRHWDVRHAQKG